jgi:hypothetical protein
MEVAQSMDGIRKSIGLVFGRREEIMRDKVSICGWQVLLHS